jgi:hypothetical protein
LRSCVGALLFICVGFIVAPVELGVLVGRTVSIFISGARVGGRVGLRVGARVDVIGATMGRLVGVSLRIFVVGIKPGVPVCGRLGCLVGFFSTIGRPHISLGELDGSIVCVSMVGATAAGMLGRLLGWELDVELGCGVGLFFGDELGA